MKTTKKFLLHSSKETLYVTCEIHGTPAYFSCTGVLIEGLRKEKTEKGIPDKKWIMCGCMHTEILKTAPSYKDIVHLHLSDENGIPMYAYENGFYYLQQALSVAKYHNPEPGDKEKYTKVLSEHLRISLSDAENLISEVSKEKTELKQRNKFMSFVVAQEPRWKIEAEAVKAKYLPHRSLY